MPRTQAARGAAPHRRALRPSTGCASATSSTPATATCIRSSSTTSAVDGEPERAEAARRRRSSTLCIDAGGSLTGEHGVGVDKACSMPKLFGERDLAAMRAAARGLRPGRPREPRQGLPDAAALRRGARPLPSTPARAGRACRASLSRDARGGRRGARRGERVSIERDGGEVVLSTAQLNRVLEHEPGDLTAIVEAGMRLSELQALPRRARPDARARPARRPDDRRVPRRRSLRAAPPPLRRDARPRARRHGRARRRDGRELGRQGREERRRLRPREALLGLARAARADRARRAAPPPAARRARRRSSSTDDPRGLWAELQRSQLVPSAVDFLPPGRLALLFEGSERAVEAQVAACPGERADGDDLGRERRARRPRAAGPRRRSPGRSAPLARPGPGIAYVAQRRPSDRGRRSPSASARHSIPKGCSPDGRELIADCVHCGFCLPSCPTYELWHEEMDSPRGRIWLMKATLDGTRSSSTDTVAEHFDRCLGCMACLTSCPSGVQYDRLIELARERVEQEVPRPLRDRLLRVGGLRRASPSAAAAFRAPLRRAACARAVRAAQGSSRRRWREAGLRRPRETPARRRARRAASACSPAASSRCSSARSTAPRRACSRPTATRSRRPTRGCCGALALHSGPARGRARARPAHGARRSRPPGVETIVTNAAGCGSHLKEARPRACRSSTSPRRWRGGHASRAPAAGAPRRLPGVLPPRATPSACATSRASCSRSIPGPRARRAGRAGALLRQRRDLQPRPAGGGPRARRPQGGERARDRARPLRQRQPRLPAPGLGRAAPRRPATAGRSSGRAARRLDPRRRSTGARLD